MLSLGDENSRWDMGGFHFIAPDSQMREVSQILYMYVIFAGLIPATIQKLSPLCEGEDN